MGVSGCGKTTVAEGLQKRFEWPFLEGDSLHSKENIGKMGAGIALTDADRAPWLASIAAHLLAWTAAGSAGIVTCSALKRAYRRTLLDHVPTGRIVYLKGSPALLLSRMNHRTGHFMPSALLDSQLATLEEPGADERPIVVDIARPLAENIEAIAQALASADPTPGEAVRTAKDA